MEYTQFTENEFLAAQGTNLSTALPNDHDPGSKVKRFIDRVCNQIIDYIEDNSPYFDKTDLTVTQNTIINQAAMEQANYILANADFSLMSGYDPFSNTMVNIDEINSRILSPSVKKRLENRIIDRRF